MKLIFMGTASFAVPILKNILKNKNKFDLVAVFTKPDSLEGRGLKKAESPIKKYLLANEKIIFQQGSGKRLKNQISLFQPKNFRESENLAILKKLNPDLIIVAAYGIILPPEVLAIPHFGCLNIHPSWLPKYRGPSPIQATILNQESETAVTIIKLNSQVDTGDIVAQQKIKMPISITAPQLNNKLAKLGGELLIKTLPNYLAGKIKLRKQTDFNQLTPSYTKIINKKNGLIGWNQPAKKIEAQIRALKPWPGTYTFFKLPKKQEELRIDIISAKALPYSKKINPGQVFIDTEKFSQPAVATAKGVLVLDKIKPAGKKEMSAIDFVNGHPDFIGTILG
ncbi:MAG: methionyl-tRNA formyltransferase [Patescibacteria group bacterium]|nr:methionyl-tRNA formyltransferase [Patescibacteria group bacterium]